MSVLQQSRERLRLTKPSTPNLTARQRSVLRYMLRCWLRGYVPTIREMCGEFGISLNAVRGHLLALKRKGYVDNAPGCVFALTDAAMELAL